MSIEGDEGVLLYVAHMTCRLELARMGRTIATGTGPGVARFVALGEWQPEVGKANGSWARKRGEAVSDDASI